MREDKKAIKILSLAFNVESKNIESYKDDVKEYERK